MKWSFNIEKKYINFGIFFFVLTYIGGIFISFLNGNLPFCKGKFQICESEGSLSWGAFFIREFQVILLGAGVTILIIIVLIFRDSVQKERYELKALKKRRKDEDKN